jgi:endonuclease/exonuclease/phosphatase family metal-dependent hydrolase
MDLRVISYNIHGCINSQRKVNVENVSKIIGSINADFIALQEVDAEKPISKNRNQARTISEGLGFDYLYFPIERADRHTFGLAIISRYPIENNDFVWLPNLYPRLKMRKRGVLRARLRTPIGSVHLINTHLSIYKLERYLQLIAVTGWRGLSDLNLHKPIILCGDLNTNPSSLIYRRLSRFFTDVQKASSPIRKPRPTFPANAPVFRIDHIFVTDHFKTVNAEVVKNELTVRASDHLPLVANLRYFSDKPSKN